MKPREFWVDPTPCDDEMQNTFDAFSEYPRQGDLLWQHNLIHVREVTAQDREKDEALYQISKGWMSKEECAELAKSVLGLNPEGESK